MRRLLIVVALVAGGTVEVLGQSRSRAQDPLTPPFHVPPSVAPSSASIGVQPTTPSDRADGPIRRGVGNQVFLPVSPGWVGGGYGYYAPPPMVFVPPASGVWRTTYDGRIFYEQVTTPVMLGTPWGYPSMPLAPQSVAPPYEVSTPPPDPVVVADRPAPAAPRVVREPDRPLSRDAARSREMTELGDRLFRGDKISHAVKRYEQAIKADPGRAEPRARLALVAASRGDYADAANALREAEAAQPGWLATASDVQALYREPTDFASLIATIESHLQTRPEDRDAWLVLGSLWYLSGRTEKAADVFLRLTDRLADPTLKAFLMATKVQ